MATVTTDAFSPAESEGSLLYNTSALVESLGSTLYDVLDPIEALLSQVPPPIQIEFSKVAYGDSRLPAEWAGAILPGYLQIEWSNRTFQDSNQPIEWLSSSSSTAVTDDALLTLEWQRTTGGSLVANSAVYFEWLARQTGDAAVSGEAVARAVNDALALLESLLAGSVAVGGESSAPLEVTAPIHTDGGLPTAWALSMSLAAYAALPCEIAGTTPSPAPAIPQVSGRRLRLFRV